LENGFSDGFDLTTFVDRSLIVLFQRIQSRGRQFGMVNVGRRLGDLTYDVKGNLVQLNVHVLFAPSHALLTDGVFSGSVFADDHLLVRQLRRSATRGVEPVVDGSVKMTRVVIVVIGQ
jgi:hypothetical protein